MTTTDFITWLGETTLAVSILILLVLIIRKPFAKLFGARAAYALWLAPAARIFLPELKLLPAPAMPAETFTWKSDPVVFFEAAAAAPAQYDLVALATAAALVLWATVAFAWFNIKLEAQGRFMRERKAASSPASPAVIAMARTIATEFRVKKLPEIRISDDETGPCLIGLFRPVIFLPAGFETDYSDPERRLALAHEIAHVARGDMAATLAALALQALQWPNPLAHLSLRAFRTDQEAACDAYVLARCAGQSNAASDYAAAILKSVRASAGAPAYGLSLAHPVKERLMLLKDQKKSPLRLFTGAATVALLIGSGLAATASYGYASETKKDADVNVKKEMIWHKADDDGETGARIFHKSKHSKMVIEADKGETLMVAGVKGAAKIDIDEEDGVRTVKVYDSKGKLLSENTYGPDDKMPFEDIVIKDKDGKEQTISVASTGGKRMHKMMFIGEPGDGEKRIMEFDFDGDHEMMMDGDHDVMFTGHCSGSDDSDHKPVLLEWKDEDNKDGVKAVTREVVCLTGDEADPAKRAEVLRKVITRMEADAKRDAERRAAMIAKMREELKEAEKKKK